VSSRSPLISLLIHLLTRVRIAEDFGFVHLLWVYSGRRGIHCWISDQAALSLTDDQRRAIVGYLEVVKGGAHQHKKVDLQRPLHPFLKRTVETVLNSPFIKVILEDQDCFRHEIGWEALLRLLPTSDEKFLGMSQKLEGQWRKNDYSSKEKWQMFVGAAKEVVESETITKKVGQNRLLLYVYRIQC
jgi:DNA primase small subunit